MKFRCLLLASMILAGCDAIQPEATSLLVVEAFVVSERPLPAITLRQAVPIQDPYDLDASTAATGAQVALVMQGASIPYTMQRPGVYVPFDSVLAVPGAELELSVVWNHQSVTARSRIPPRISLDSLDIVVSDTPMPGLLLESLFIDPSLVDSLGLRALGQIAQEGLIHLIEATLYWEGSATRAGDNWWMRLQLLPALGGDQRLGNYFLSPEVLRRETEIPYTYTSFRSWSGSYAVQVTSETDPVPAHALRVSIIRCTQAYADFVSGSLNPGEVEPPSNISGGRGIFAGIALDTMTVQIR